MVVVCVCVSVAGGERKMTHRGADEAGQELFLVLEPLLVVVSHRVCVVLLLVVKVSGFPAFGVCRG